MHTRQHWDLPNDNNALLDPQLLTTGASWWADYAVEEEEGGAGEEEEVLLPEGMWAIHR